VDNVHGNLNYALWSFEQQKQLNNAPNAALRMLVRTSVHGYINTESASFNVTTRL
jgi:hypothetical protein